ncbi:spore germination protein [Paenibacillus sp. ACRRX]|uniref:spore germination protein n=1 Tax=Paenibacillus sp. ACRRX TaxID=2918206 RepID=UPI001EF49F9E|nr:spore germination protein [Paenibacillus sp. ACRRX]MCG7406882.1 spore germination protein [Paenibacillus sp. ACRRX]
MFKWMHRQNQHVSAQRQQHSPSRTVEQSYDNALEEIQARLQHIADISYQQLHPDKNSACTLIYIESIIDMTILYDQIIAPLQAVGQAATEGDMMSAALAGSITSVQSVTVLDVKQVVAGILDGSAALIVDNQTAMCLFPISKYSQRSISEAQNEVLITGPQEAFVESINANVSLVRHKLKHPDFKMIKYSLGEYTQTTTYLMYIEGLCDSDTLQQIGSKLSEIQIDSILGSNYVAEFIDHEPLSPFPIIQFTERPDTLVASLLEGRIGIMVDGAPQTLIVPVTFFSLMQSPEDYFQQYVASTWIRWIRFFFVIASFLVPSIYIAITTFHPEMLPSDLLTTIAAAREKIPFPALAEVLIMELTFEGLREAGIRIPRPLGQTVSIIGAIVIGQAAVQAGVVSAPTVIVVSITGIASFIIPHFELGLSFRLLRFPLLIMGGALGLYGIIIGMFIMYWHLVTLRSFGVPYLYPLAPLVFQDWKDVFWRVRWPKMNKRPYSFGSSREQRQQIEDE